MEMTVKEYAEREGIKSGAAQARLKRLCKRTSYGTYEVPDDMSIRRKLEGEELEHIKDMLRRGYKTWQIAEMTGIPASTISYRAGGVYKLRREFIAELAQQGLSAREIADKAGVVKHTVCIYLRKLGMKYDKDSGTWKKSKGEET